jgi:Bacterial Ig domain
MKALLAFGVLLSAIALPAADHVTLLPTGADAKFHVPADGSLGTNWTGTSFDDITWTDVITPVGFDQPNGPLSAGGVIADSVAQFSGNQGANNWYYGYWDRNADPDGTYQSFEFTPFPREPGNDTLGANNFWDGSKWDWFNGNPPYTELGANGGHPAHHNGGGGAIHLPIRRWVSTINGTIHITGSLLASAPCGDGVIGRIFVDGEEVKSFPSAGSTAEFAVNATVQIGSTVDFAIDPGPANDFCDSFSFSAKILQNTIADSVEDWSVSGQQGSRGWSYGFYNRTADGDGIYHPNTDFNTTDPNWTFGGAWGVGPADPPWTSLGQTDVHPNGLNNGTEHWPIRRYTSAEAGRVLLSGTIVNVGCGGDVNARIFVDGVQVFSRVVGGSGYGFAVAATVAVGSKIDFALDPNGGDGCDATRFTATISPVALGATLIADSAAEFSGTQGQDNWHYGYYNRSTDGDAAYDPNADFNVSDPNWTFGGSWSLGPADPPWTTLGAIDIHPNSGPEQWVIRRWVAEAATQVSVFWHFGKSNPNGSGSTFLVMQNGVVKDSAAITGGDKGGVNRVVTLNVQAGDKIDFAQTPVGPGGEPDDGADGSTFNALIYQHGYNPGAACMQVADSQADWSATGDQNFRGWTYGYYNKTADGDLTYQPADLNTNLTWNSWAGAAWAFTPGPAPWTSIGQTGLHPNGVNNGPEHWVIRRWTSSVSGRIRVDWKTAKSNPGGSGVTGLVLHNGAVLDSVTLAGNDTLGVSRSITLPSVSIGDVIDLALTPIGPGGATDDGADGSVNSMTIYVCTNVSDCVTTDVAAQMKNVNATAYLRLPFNSPDPACLDQLRLRMKYDDGFVAYLNGVEVARRNAPSGVAGGHLANSSGDWTPNAQGANNWFHGYYNKTADSDHLYQPSDFNTNLTWGAWAGAAWAYTPGPAPWTSVGQGSWHPNGDNNGDVHWVIRRWVSETTGDVVVNLRFSKGGVGGNGVTGRLFRNGTQVFSQTIAFNDTTGVNTNFTVTGLLPGDALDFALDPLGTDASESDGSDGSNGYMDVRQNPSPALSWNSRATAARTTAQALETEVIDITAFKSALMPGGNVLAIHALNRCVDDPDFLLSPEITATVLPPAILSQPQSRTNQLGETAEFNVSAQSCTAASYQWRFNSLPIPGETADTIFIDAQPANQGGYDLVVSNAGGSVTSTVAILTVNRNPVALDNGLTTLMNASITLHRDKVLNNDSDPDGDALTLVSVASPTAQGGTATLVMGNVHFTPSPGFIGTDTFTYTISDGRGGTGTANIEVFVYSGALPSKNQVLLAPTADGYKVRFAGVPGRQYIIQRTTDLTPPVVWTSLQTLTAPAHGIMEYDDTTNLPSAYYRTAVAP